jgi:phosphoglycolate phosphatase-like HAD superfamily hydrolase
VERGEAMLGHDAPNSEIFVIGDTPLDIQAAHAVDCTAIGVAAGKSPTHVRSPQALTEPNRSVIQRHPFVE